MIEHEKMFTINNSRDPAKDMEKKYSKLNRKSHMETLNQPLYTYKVASK